MKAHIGVVWIRLCVHGARHGWHAAALSRKALQRIEALHAEPVLAQPQRPALPQGRGIRFEQVDFRYEGAQQPALQGVSCTLAANSLTAIVRPSGAGKSTLVQLIAWLWDVSAGAIYLCKADMRGCGPWVQRDEVRIHAALGSTVLCAYS